MEPYSGFAGVYDKLMEDVPYDKWIENINSILSEEGLKPKTVLELACGTGTLCVKISEMGYNVTGIDISEEMLTIAKNKSLMKRQKIEFLNQDISDFQVTKKFDLIISLCDGINYIVDKMDIENLFERVYENLNDDGIFIFDISSYYKLKNVLGNNNISEADEDVAFIWENYFDDENNILEFDLSIFIESNGIYKRYNEEHVQKAYKVSDLEKIYNKNFFAFKIFDEEFEDINDETERIFFALKKRI